MQREISSSSYVSTAFSHTSGDHIVILDFVGKFAFFSFWHKVCSWWLRTMNLDSVRVSVRMGTLKQIVICKHTDWPGLIFGWFYSRYSVIFPMPKSIFFSQFSEENSQFQVLKNFENKSSICLVEVGLKMCVQHVYSGFPITKISVVWTGCLHFSTVIGRV